MRSGTRESPQAQEIIPEICLHDDARYVFDTKLLKKKKIFSYHVALFFPRPTIMARDYV